jgi:hypothetical protein
MKCGFGAFSRRISSMMSLRIVLLGKFFWIYAAFAG